MHACLTRPPSSLFESFAKDRARLLHEKWTEGSASGDSKKWSYLELVAYEKALMSEHMVKQGGRLRELHEQKYKRN